MDASQAPPRIDPSLPTPIYSQLKTLLLDEMLTGRYGPGGRLPTEHELCARHRISRTPVSRALAELAGEGVIVRRRRVGSFVNPAWLRHSHRRELRVIVEQGPWADLVRDACPAAITLAVATVPRPDLHETLTRAVAEGTAPDLAIVDTVWVPEFAAAGFLHSLDDLDAPWMRLEYETDFLPTPAAAGRYGGRTYGVVMDATVSGLWYRCRDLERAGIAPPATWAELRTAARAVARRHRFPHPIAMTGGLRGGETTAFSLISWLASNGASVMEEGRVRIDSEATAQTLRFLQALVRDGLMSRDVVDFEWDRPVRLLAARQAAFSLGGSYEAPKLAGALRVPFEALPEYMGFIPIPAGPHGRPASCAGGKSVCVFRQTQHPALAMRMLESIVAPAALANPTRMAGRIPARRSALALAAPRVPYLAQMPDMFDHAVNRPSIPLYPRVSLQLQSMLESVLAGRLGVTAAARQAQERIEAIIGEPSRAGTGGERF
jgi:multiple sugar transport system substrate-binding protein